MTEQSRRSSTSRGSTLNTSSTLRREDPKHLFQATITDIEFGPSSSDVSTIRVTIGELLTSGFLATVAENRPQLRWIHLPANNMSWVEELLATLNEEEQALFTQDDEADNESTIYKSVLPDDLWRRTFHGRLSNDIHCRFMRPLATSYCPVDHESSSSDDDETLRTDGPSVTALYMPYLHWEAYNSWKNRQERISRLKELERLKRPCDCLDGLENNELSTIQQNEALLHEYLYHGSPLHDRRTLDQSYYYNLDRVAYRDDDQVIGQHTWRNFWRDRNSPRDPKRKMMMVDQLWMWVIEGHTIISAFPETDILGVEKEDNDEDGANILKKLLNTIEPAIRQRNVKSVSGLLALIIDTCTGVFHRSDIHPDLAFLESFAIVIGKTKLAVDQLLLDFSSTSNSIETLWTDQTVSFMRLSRELEPLLTIKREIELLGDIERIMNDLAKIDFLCGQQQEVMQNLLKSYRPDRRQSRQHSLKGSSTTATTYGNSRGLTELHETIKSRRKLWREMYNTASELHKSLHHILDLKQRQAAVSEARTVRNQIAISARQGHSIMILTIFTVLLLPPSVIAAVFGMNVKEWIKDRGGVPLKTIGVVMIPTTVILVLVTLLFAFNERMRMMTSHLYQAMYPNWSSPSVVKTTEIQG